MAPLTPDWQQPSHPKTQKVIFASKEQYLSNSYSTIALPPFGFYAKLSFPPCTEAFEPTYATVQMGKDRHLNLNSDLVYINHSCEPSLIFDTSSLSVLAGPRGLSPGDELTFFYPSTEWDMAQGFDCFCGKPTCKGYISGAANMTPQQLEGLFLNAHIRELLEERNSAVKNGNGKAKDATEEALRGNVVLAKKMVGFAQKALESYIGGDKENGNLKNGAKGRNGVGNREMCGEMGGDTIAV